MHPRPYIGPMPDDERTDHYLTGHDQTVSHTPPGFTAVGVFLLFAAIVASVAATTLLWRGTPVDRIWALKQKAYNQLAPLGRTVGILFLLLAAALAASGIGWFRRRLWGWRLAVVIFATQMVGDLSNVFRGDHLGGAIGFAIAGALLFYLFRPRVRACFGPRSH